VTRNGSRPTLKLLRISLALCGVVLCGNSVNLQAGILRLGTQDAAKPFFDGPSTVIHMIRQAVGSQQLQLEIVYLPRMRSLAQANQGYIDGDLIRVEGIVREAKNLIKVPEPICLADYYIYSLTHKTQSNYWKDFKKPQPILLTDMQGIQKLWPQQLLSVRTYSVADIQQGIRAIKYNKGNMLLLPDGILEMLPKETAGIPFIKLEPKTGTQPVFMWLHKRHKALASKLAQALKREKLKLQQAGTIQTVNFACGELITPAK
jgi:polar amino acid transport system substrate-binding protein